MKVLLFGILFCLILHCLAKPTNQESDEVIEDLDDGPKIFGGNPAKAQQFPFMVSIQFADLLKGGDFNKFCGGSLIESDWVLTAAHCCEFIKEKGIEKLTFVRAGVTEAYATTPGHQLKKVGKIIIHEDYKGGTNPHDICLLKMKEKFAISQHVQIITRAPYCEPNRNRGYIIGFGRIKQDIPTDQLNYVEVGLASMKWCESNYRNILPEYHICPGEKGKGSCPGDSGGPFVRESVNNEMCLEGVDSFTKIPCHTAPASIYVKVSAYDDWINKKIQENS